MSPVVRLLTAVYARLEAPGRWTQGVSARDSAGLSVCATDTTAICWCAIGALDRETFDLGIPLMDADRALWILYGLTYSSDVRKYGVGRWNDRSTQQQVLAGIARAIELAKENA